MSVQDTNTCLMLDKLPLLPMILLAHRLPSCLIATFIPKLANKYELFEAFNELALDFYSNYYCFGTHQ